MAKHLVDIDEGALTAARAELGTDRLKDTVNEALRTRLRYPRLTCRSHVDRLATADLADREDAWR